MSKTNVVSYKSYIIAYSLEFDNTQSHDQKHSFVEQIIDDLEGVNIDAFKQSRGSTRQIQHQYFSNRSCLRSFQRENHSQSISFNVNG